MNRTNIESPLEKPCPWMRGSSQGSSGGSASSGRGPISSDSAASGLAEDRKEEGCFGAAFWSLSSHALLHGVAGALASLLSMFLLYPFDQIRVLLQGQSDVAAGPVGSASLHSRLLGQTIAAAQEVLQKQGIAGFYRGVWATLQTIGISYFIYFFLYNGLKAKMQRGTAPQAQQKGRLVDCLSGVVGDMFASCLSGVLNVLITSPLWVAVMRLRFSKDSGPPRNVWEEMFNIAATEGVQALWSGTWVSLVLVANPIVQFVAYDAFKKAQLRRKAARLYEKDEEAEQVLPPASAATLSAREAFVIGASSKGVSTFLTYPLQMAQTMQRVTAEPGAGGGAGLLSLLISVVRTRGLLALYAGLEAKIWQTVLNGALMFMFYERIVAVVVQCTAIAAPFQPPGSRTAKTL